MQLLITADFCPINRIKNFIDKADYSSIYNDFIPIIKNTDIAITNLECPIINKAKKRIKTGPNLTASKGALDALTYGGFNIVTLANNHILDYGEEGLTETMEYCTKSNIDFVGVGSNINEARKPLYKTLNNTTIGIINFCENEWSTTNGELMGANPLNIVNNFYDIKKAKSKADHVFVIIHGGHEHYQLPSPRMQKTYRFFIEAGADIVIGHHTHCFSGYEKYRDKLIFYSLGNFIFDWKNKRDCLWNKGYAVLFTINKKNISFTLYPYIQGDEVPGVRQMNGNEKKEFESELTQLNNLIGDSKEIERKFNSFINLRKKEYLSYFEPYSNRYLLALYRRGFLPSFVHEQKKRLLLNTIRCESHRDVLLKILKD